jgi:hypothetical protein
VAALSLHFMTHTRYKYYDINCLRRKLSKNQRLTQNLDNVSRLHAALSAISRFSGCRAASRSNIPGLDQLVISCPHRGKVQSIISADRIGRISRRAANAGNAKRGTPSKGKKGDSFFSPFFSVNVSVRFARSRHFFGITEFSQIERAGDGICDLVDGYRASESFRDVRRECTSR